MDEGDKGKKKRKKGGRKRKEWKTRRKLIIRGKNEIKTLSKAQSFFDKAIELSLT